MEYTLTEEEHNAGLNVCNKCGIKIPSEDLVWISAEDFEPKDGENVPRKVYEEYDALCEPCYLSVLDA